MYHIKPHKFVSALFEKSLYGFGSSQKEKFSLEHLAKVIFLAFNRFMADHDAWRELAEIYVSLQM